MTFSDELSDMQNSKIIESYSEESVISPTFGCLSQDSSPFTHKERPSALSIQTNGVLGQYYLGPDVPWSPTDLTRGSTARLLS